MSYPNAFSGFPAALVPILQTNMLDREFEEGLDSFLAYRRSALLMTLAARTGETLTRTRKSRKAPVRPVSDASVLSAGLDNGMTPSTFTIEQYVFSMVEIHDTVDTDLMAELATIADNLIANVRNNGVQAAQSLERYARFKAFGAYLSGNSFVDSPSGNPPTTTTCHVDNIVGFDTVMVNGQLVSVSAANPLTVTEYETAAGGHNQTLQITGVTPDAVNISLTNFNDGYGQGISGTLTFNAATNAPVAGDTLIAANAPQILRPRGKLLTPALSGQDTFTMGLVEDGVALLRDNGVPPCDDGTYHCLNDNTSMRQLFADQDFKVLFAGSNQAYEYRSGEIIRLLGVTFIPTTEAPLQPAAGTTTNGVPINVRVRRPMVHGAEYLLQGNFEGIDIYLNRQGVAPLGEVAVVNNVAHLLRPPLDREMRMASASWFWIGDFAVPTDITATPSIIPTASNALFKRAVIIEHAG